MLASFLDDDAIGNAEVLVKWRGRSHIHDSWVRVDDLKEVKGYRKVQNYINAEKSKMLWYQAATPEEREVYSVHVELDRHNREAFTKVERVL